MGWADWRARSQSTLRRAPRTGRQQAKRTKTGSGVIVREALRDRFVESGAGVAARAVGSALDQTQEGRRARGRGVGEAMGHRDEVPARRREPVKEALRFVVHGFPSRSGAPPLG